MMKMKESEHGGGMREFALVLVVIAVLFGSPVSAFGVGSAYYKEHPLEISPGETKDIIFNLQNGPGPDSITAKPSVSKGSEIMEIDLANIVIPVGGSVDVIAKVSAPSDAKIGDVYPVEISFTTVEKSGPGAFGLGSSVGKSFDVIIVPTAEERAGLAEKGQTNPLMTYLVIGVIILVILIWFMLKKKWKRK